ncbi:MAG TPA: hypothetical protein VG537_03035 [Candidatus Kapabacteria bacterium]|jgi:hypothetical protein|nr:hypothetical protein [Candidatus Kapabacteria bacterium]
MNIPQILSKRAIAWIALSGAILSSCAVSPNGPTSAGASHGSLGSTNMCDYYYKKDAGWTYVYQNVEKIYNSTGTVTLTAANDTLRTLGYNGIAPNGDSLFRLQITYRVLSSYAGRGQVDINYISNGHSQNGAFVDGTAQITGVVTMDKKPRPVSTDTILAGVVGRVRTLCNDFTNTGSYAWQTDTLWFSSHSDSVLIWERFPGLSTLSCSRLVFCNDFSNNVGSNGTGSNVSWCYDLIWQSTYLSVDDANQSLTVPAGTYPYTVKLNVYTPAVSDNMPTTEYKWFSCGVGFTKEYDSWRVTSDGTNFTSEDFTRSLISLTHN